MKTYPKLNIGVGGVILNNRSEILLIKRKSNPNVWAIPSGYMENNETIYETIIRETKEETNVNIKPKGIIGIRQRLSDNEGNNLWIIVIADYLSGKPVPDNTEVNEAKFVLLAEARMQVVTPVTRRIMELVSDNKQQVFTPQKNLSKQSYAFFA